MHPVAAAIDQYLQKRVNEALDLLRDLPEDDLNTWLPEKIAGEVNTFAALATHLVGSGEYWIGHVVGGQPSDRDRPAEFTASATFANLEARYAAWLANCTEVLTNLTESDLARVVTVPGQDPEQWTVALALVHALEHTTTHLGHLQIQRQLWDGARQAAG